jgi:hypothetical protein
LRNETQPRGDPSGGLPSGGDPSGGDPSGGDPRCFEQLFFKIGCAGTLKTP